jgi:hypothetical protein
VLVKKTYQKAWLRCLRSSAAAEPLATVATIASNCSDHTSFGIHLAAVTGAFVMATAVAYVAVKELPSGRVGWSGMHLAFLHTAVVAAASFATASFATTSSVAASFAAACSPASVPASRCPWGLAETSAFPPTL